MLLFSMHTMMWKNVGKHCSRSWFLCMHSNVNMCELGISLKCKFRFSSWGFGPKNSLFFFNKLLILVQGPHLNLWAPGDYICGSETLVFMRITWGMWIKCCFLGSTLQRFYVTVVGWGPGMCIFMSAHVIIIQVVSCQDFEKHCSRSQWNDN